MKKIKLLLPLLCMGLILTGCGNKVIPKLEDGKEVIASIEGKDITTEELYAELKKQGGTSVIVNLIDKFIVETEKISDEDANSYAEGQITTIKSQYETYGQDFDSALASAGYKSISELKENLALDYKKNKIAENYVKTTISEKDINNYYKDSIFGKMNVRYILVKPETTDNMTDEEKTNAENAALTEAKEVIAKLKKGEKFEDLAKKHSDDKTTANEGGLYSGFAKNDVVEEFWAASVNLKDGAYTTSPVKSSYGYFVILRINQDEKPSLEDSKEEIVSTLASEEMSADEYSAVKSWVEIRKKYDLNIIDSDILSEYEKTISQYK